MTRVYTRRPVMERILEKTEIVPGPLDTPCWVFTGATVRGTYGKTSQGGRSGGLVYVHVAAYQHLVGPVPTGLDLDHLCRVKRCLCPEHLEPVTRSENQIRMWAARKAAP